MSQQSKILRKIADDVSPSRGAASALESMARRKLPTASGAQASRAEILLAMIRGGESSRVEALRIWQSLPVSQQTRIAQEMVEQFPPAPGRQTSIDAATALEFLASGRATGTGLEGVPVSDIPDPIHGKPNNLLRSQFQELEDAGIVRGDFADKPALRSPEMTADREEIVLADIGGGKTRRMTRAEATDQGLKFSTTGSKDKVLMGQERSARKGESVSPATDWQVRAGNTSPQQAFESRIVDAAFSREPSSSDLFMGEGPGGGVWGQLRGESGPPDPRSAFQSPRQFAEFIASRINPQAVTARSSGLPASARPRLSNEVGLENMIREFENRPGVTPAEADRMARERGIPRTPQERLAPGMESLVDRLEVMARERFGDQWGDQYSDVLADVPAELQPAVSSRAPAPDTTPVPGGGIDDPKQEFPPGRSFRDEVDRAEPVPADSSRVMVDGRELSPSEVAAYNKTQKWPKKVDAAMKARGMAGPAPRSPAEIEADLAKLEDTPMTPKEYDRAAGPLLDELERSKTVSPLVYKKKNKADDVPGDVEPGPADIPDRNDAVSDVELGPEKPKTPEAEPEKVPEAEPERVPDPEPEKTPEVEAEKPKTPEEDKGILEWAKNNKGKAAAGVGAGAVAIAALINALRGSSHSSGVSLVDRLEGGGKDKELVASLADSSMKAELTRAKNAGMTGDDADLIRQLTKRDAIRDSYKVNRNTQTHSNWIR